MDQRLLICTKTLNRPNKKLEMYALYVHRVTR
eukprot:Gb_20649 [translate_table: standard]